MLHEVPCPQCGSWDQRIILNEGDRRIVKCRHCHLMFTSPQMTDAERVKSLDVDYDPVSSDEQYAASLSYQRERIIRTVELTGSRRGGWLDVGCAAGVLLDEAQKAGFTPYGFELHSAYTQKLRAEHGWDVRTTDSLATAGFTPHSFNVISLIDTLYYMPNPLQELATIKELLAPDGIFTCKVVNAPYMLFKSVGLINYLRFCRWSNMNTDYYVLHFSTKSLTSLLDKAGFRIIASDVGQPWMVGNKLNVLLKSYWAKITRYIYKISGINMGASIEVWAVLK